MEDGVVPRVGPCSRHHPACSAHESEKSITETFFLLFVFLLKLEKPGNIQMKLQDVLQMQQIMFLRKERLIFSHSESNGSDVDFQFSLLFIIIFLTLKEGRLVLFYTPQYQCKSCLTFCPRTINQPEYNSEAALLIYRHYSPFSKRCKRKPSLESKRCL